MPDKQMKVVLSWLVANLEVTMAVIISTILIPIYLVRMDLIQYIGGDGWIMVASMLVVTFLPVAFTTKNFGNSVGMFILLLAGYIYLYSVSGDLPADSPYYPPVRRMMFSGPIAFILAIPVGIYTARNMDDVVSRRMLYVNSRVSMFDMTLKYSLNRFIVAFAYLSWAAFGSAVLTMIEKDV